MLASDPRGEVLYPRRNDFTSFQKIPLHKTDACSDICLWKHVTELLKNYLGTTAISEPIGYKQDFWGGQISLK